jgi:hypothetical protein
MGVEVGVWQEPFLKVRVARMGSAREQNLPAPVDLHGDIGPSEATDGAVSDEPATNMRFVRGSHACAPRQEAKCKQLRKGSDGRRSKSEGSFPVDGQSYDSHGKSLGANFIIQRANKKVPRLGTHDRRRPAGSGMPPVLQAQAIGAIKVPIDDGAIKANDVASRGVLGYGGLVTVVDHDIAWGRGNAGRSLGMACRHKLRAHAERCAGEKDDDEDEEEGHM